MKTKALVIIVLMAGLKIFSGTVFGQVTPTCENFLESLPAHLDPSNSAPQTYVLTTDYVDYDLFGNFIRKKRITGECTLLMNGFVKWNNIKTAHSENQAEEFPEGEVQPVMENFTYNPASDILSDTFFSSIPQADVYMKNLVWDLTAIETFAWHKWDLLKLNVEFSVNEVNFEIKIPRVGTFENKDVRITWTGITKINYEICAIIKYMAMNNPLQMNSSDFEIKGRSHYWGNIFVSLSDKQIEFADLYEDVLMDIKINGQEGSSKANTVRKITLEKIR